MAKKKSLYEILHGWKEMAGKIDRVANKPSASEVARKKAAEKASQGLQASEAKKKRLKRQSASEKGKREFLEREAAKAVKVKGRAIPKQPVKEKETRAEAVARINRQRKDIEAKRKSQQEASKKKKKKKDWWPF